MTLEALNTTFAGAAFAVIGATAIAAIVQLRHLRASNQINALLTILQDWQKAGNASVGPVRSQRIARTT